MDIFFMDFLYVYISSVYGPSSHSSSAIILKQVPHWPGTHLPSKPGWLDSGPHGFLSQPHKAGLTSTYLPNSSPHCNEHYWWYLREWVYLSPSPSSIGPVWKLWGGDAQCWGLIWDRDSSAAKGLSLHLCFCWVQGCLLLGGHIDHEVHYPGIVAKFVVIVYQEWFW